MGRRPVAVVAAVVLILEAVGMAAIHWVLGAVVDRQRMSLAGLDPHATSLGTKVLGGLVGLFLLFCAGLLLRSGMRDRAPSRLGRWVLIGCAVLHGLLGALTASLVGWGVYGFMMVVLALLVLVLVGYDERLPGRTGGRHRGTSTRAPAPAVGPEADPA
ncbi:hypothetical protein [Streptomyces sp. TP-A0874]|uniref:hypothetical protein n=1 Tax=Streptomyces sp. TP-A0874 TaxID=549819 RepID=UPI001BAEA5D3